MSQPNYNFKTYSQTHWSMFRPWTYGTEFIPTFSIASSIFLHACFFFFLFHVRIQLLTSLRYQTLCIHKPTHLFIIFLSKPLKKHWLYRSYTSSIYWWYTKLSLPVVDLCWPVKQISGLLECWNDHWRSAMQMPYVIVFSLSYQSEKKEKITFLSLYLSDDLIWSCFF